MKKYTRLTFITSAMMMLSTQAVFAQTTTDEKPSEVTTSEVTTVSPTTQEETTTTTTEQVSTRRKREVSNEETQTKEVEKSTYTGFVTRDGVTYYHINKVPITRQWKQIDQKWYYFDEEGKMLKNTTFDGYAFDHEGVMGTNQWMTIQGERYYVTESGKYLKDTWKQFDGKWYYFDRAGRMQKNTLVNGYLMGDNGALVTNRWVTFNEKWYYAQEKPFKMLGNKLMENGICSIKMARCTPMNLTGTTIIKLAVKWPMMNGYLIQPTIAGSISNLVVLMPEMNGKAPST